MGRKSRKHMSREAQGIVPSLRVDYKADVKVGGSDKCEVDGKPADLYLGYWNESSKYHFVKLDSTFKGTFELPLYSGQLDTLKLEMLAEFSEPNGFPKPFPLDSSFACMRQLCSGKPVEVVMRDPFQEKNVTKLTLQAQSPVSHPNMLRSSVYDTNLHNQALGSMAGKIMSDIQLNNLHVPPAGEPFSTGVTYYSAGGNESLGVEPVQTNYSTLNSDIMSSERTLPLPVVLVGLQQTLLHHGHTVQGALDMKDRDFARLLGSVVGGGTEDAAMQPYVSDYTLGYSVAFDFTKDPPISYKMGPVMTENIGSYMAASQFVSRVYPDTLRVDPSGGKYMLEKKGMTEIWEELHAREWPAYNLSLNSDDCETQFYGQQMAARTIMLCDVSKANLKKECKGFSSFSNWTDSCYERASAFLTRAQELLNSTKVVVANAIGLAGGASASAGNAENSAQDKIDNMQGLNGHCFGVLRYSSDDDLYVRLLEGTTASFPYRCHAKTGTYTTSDGKVSLRLDLFLTQLGYTLSLETQVCNQVIGEEVKGGWDGPRKIACMRRSTMVLPCLHSENLAAGSTYKKLAQNCGKAEMSSKSRDVAPGCGKVNSKASKNAKLSSPVCIPFYQWCMFTGLQCDESSVGCMPVDEDEYRDEKRMGAGCRPGELAKKGLKAVNAGMPKEMVEVGRRIFEEIMPPNASRETVNKLMNSWSKLEPLVEVNRGVQGKRESGVDYYTTAVMESPCNPELTPYLYAVKSRLAEKFNEINSKAKNSDKIFFTTGLTATGVSLIAHAQDRDHTLTAMASLKKAKQELGWPGPASITESHAGKGKHVLN